MSAARPRQSVKLGNRAIALQGAARRRERARGVESAAELRRASRRAASAAGRAAMAANPGIAAHRARTRREALKVATFRRVLSGVGLKGIGGRNTALARARRVSRTAALKRRHDLDAAIRRLERVGVVTALSSPAQQRLGTIPRGPRARRLTTLQRALERRRRINPRKRTMAKKKRNRLGHYVKSAARKLRRARDKFGHFLATGKRRKKRSASRRRTKRNPSTGGTMSRALVANPRKRRRKRRAPSTALNPRRRRRRARRNPGRRRHYRRNPSGLMGAAMSSILPMGLGGIGGAIAGFADAKLMSDMPVVSALSKVATGALGAVLLRRRPALAFGWAGGVMGSFGYSMGVKAAGGLVAHSPTSALKGIADMASDNPEMAALLEGLGDLEPGVGDTDQVGDASDYNESLGDLVE